LSVIAELGNAEMTIEDFLYLQVGDVVKLNRKIDQSEQRVSLRSLRISVLFSPLFSKNQD